MATPTTPEAIKVFEDSLRAFLTDPDLAAKAAVVMRTSHERFMDLITGPRHQFVRYDALIDRVVYENADTFYTTRESPSDCRWMVPGT